MTADRIAAIHRGRHRTGLAHEGKRCENKVAAPFREAEFEIIYGEGISREATLLDLAANQNIVGNWFTGTSYKGSAADRDARMPAPFLKETKNQLAKLES